MKKLLSIILSVVLMFTALPFGVFNLTANAATSGYYTYTVADGKATITDVDTAVSGNITVPSTLGGYPVTSIGEYAFEDCASITIITIPNSVTSIGEGAFRDCSSLASITLPFVGSSRTANCTSDAVFGYIFGYSSSSGISAVRQPYDTYTDCYNYYFIPSSIKTVNITDTTQIPYGAFSNCSFIENITIPNGIISIGVEAFALCSSLESVDIPDSVTNIGGFAFYYCTSLTSITIPNSVTSIGRCTFSDCTSLESIDIPQGVTSVGADAFSDTAWYNNQPDGPVYAGKVFCEYKGDCPAKVTIREDTVEIADLAFYKCPSVESITISNSVTRIGDNAFESCTSLASVTIGNSVINIGKDAFESCTSLESVDIPDSVTSIGDNAFESCTSLTSVAIGNSVINIGKDAFYNCSSIESIVIPDSVKSIGYWAFCKCLSLTSVTIGDGLASIDFSTFYRCSSLKNISIPQSVKIIDDSAFYGCSSLVNVWYSGSESNRFNISIGEENSCLENAIWHYNICPNEHDYDNSCDTSCNLCDYTRIITHNYKTVWSKDKLQHWHECSVCKDKIDIEEHYYGNAGETECSVCGFCGYIPGDINDSGAEPDLDDVVALAQIVAGWQGVAHNEAALDVNGDGDITLDDVVLLAQFVAGWSVTLS